jgi:hypothetical protein
MEEKTERRRHRRIKANMLVFFESAGRWREEEVECVDVSLGGLQVIAPHPFAVGHELNCKLGMLNDVIPLEIPAKVLSACENKKQGCKTYVIRLGFVHNDQLTMVRLKDYISRKSDQK